MTGTTLLAPSLILLPIRSGIGEISWADGAGCTGAARVAATSVCMTPATTEGVQATWALPYAPPPPSSWAIHAGDTIITASDFQLQLLIPCAVSIRKVWRLQCDGSTLTHSSRCPEWIFAVSWAANRASKH